MPGTSHTVRKYSIQTQTYGFPDNPLNYLHVIVVDYLGTVFCAGGNDTFHSDVIRDHPRDTRRQGLGTSQGTRWVRRSSARRRQVMPRPTSPLPTRRASLSASCRACSRSSSWCSLRLCPRPSVPPIGANWRCLQAALYIYI